MSFSLVSRRPGVDLKRRGAERRPSDAWASMVGIGSLERALLDPRKVAGGVCHCRVRALPTISALRARLGASHGGPSGNIHAASLGPTPVPPAFGRRRHTRDSWTTQRAAPTVSTGAWSGTRPGGIASLWPGSWIRSARLCASIEDSNRRA